MLVVTIAGAPQPPRRRLRKARPKDADPDERATVPLTTLTAIRPEPLGEEEQARAWLAALRDDEDGLGDYAREAAVFVNRAIHAHRTAALDPDVRDISLPGSLAVRIGYGDGEALADGRWDEAAELPGDARKGRYETLAPQERVAAIIGHHEPVDAATGALLRARSDVEAERLRDAALQLRVGLEAMLADTEAFGASGQKDDLAALGERRRVTGEAANAALRGELADEQAAATLETLAICERVLRRRKAYG